MKWERPMREVLISRLNGKSDITPTDMDGDVHHPLTQPDIDVILVYYGAITSLIKDGNICIRGNRLIIEVDVVIGREKCLVVKVVDTSGEEL